MNKNVTSANAVAVMTAADLFPQGFRLEQFSSDASFSQGDDTIAETRMGVDGHMVAGFTPSIKTVTITLEPSSPSLEYLETIYKASQQNLKTYEIGLIITMPALNKVRTYSGGVMKTGKILPDGQKTLAPIAFTFDFEKVE